MYSGEMIKIIDIGWTDPYMNIASEEYLFRNSVSDEEYFLLYINNPSIIIGRNQNPFLEINPRVLTAQKFPIVRRISGGGTVFHDLGNVSFSFINKLGKNMFNRYREFTKPIITTLAVLGINAYLDERNNIRIDGKKISGNAQFTSKNKIISHGTLLFDSDLKTLNEVLDVPKSVLQTKATASVKSEVTNICNHLNNEISIIEFKERLIKNLAQNNSFEKITFSDNQQFEIRKLADNKYRTWEWTFGETPVFSYTKMVFYNNRKIIFEIEVREGNLFAINYNAEFLPSYAEALINNLIGTRFNYGEILGKINDLCKTIVDERISNTLADVFNIYS